MKPRYHYEEYLQKNQFLKYLNNEISEKDPEIRARFMALEKLMLIKGNLDTVINPKESSWFEYYGTDGQDIVKLEDSEFYKQDFIGLRQMMEDNKVEFVEFSGKHVLYTQEEYDNHLLRFFKEN